MDPNPPRIWRPDVCVQALDMDAGDRFVTHAIAGAGSRCVAALLDVALALLLTVVPFVWLVLPLGLEPAVAAAAAGLLAVVVHVVLCWACEVVFEGQSPGKNVCALRVVSITGRSASAGQIALRSLMRLVDFLPGFYFVGLVSVLVSGQTRRLGDLAAGTAVIHEAGLSAQLETAGVPSSVYSTSEDGYLLECFLAREERLNEPFRTLLAKHLTEHLAGRYPAAASAVPGALRTTAPAAFLRRLHEAETGAAE